MTNTRLLAVLEPEVADRRQTEGGGGNVPGVTTEITISRCEAHGFMCVIVNGLRITPSKCCGSWKILRRWRISTKDFVEDIHEATEPRGP